MYVDQDKITTRSQNGILLPWSHKLNANVKSSSSFDVQEPYLIPVDVNKLYAPQHLLLIPDGHRRWAKKNNASYELAYQIASSIGISFVDAFLRSTGVHIFTMYLIGEHTLYRSSEELSPIFVALNHFLRQLSSLPLDTCSIEVVGRISMLPKTTQDLARSINGELQCDTDKQKKLNILLGYSGTRNIWRKERSQDMRHIEKINCIYRLGDKCRLSDAPILESTNSILLVSPTLFPDLSFADIQAPFSPIYNQPFYESAYKIAPVTKEIQ